ncbi:pancreatic triacylglycerol lipase-like isoform X2 [Dendropsophus ebraccatus]|uniref:pancreatic triacylglycerol lipase-like isoform X2 n=1 Tax=Dendropsophus ebraccatus TaxID=150705 RepID=UPI003831AEFC
MLVAVLIFLAMAVCVQGEMRCYDDMGCVSNDPPFQSPTRLISIFPQSPEEINTRFFLFTVNNTDQYQAILKVEDVNCVCVDWSGGSSAIYFQAMNNVQVVGAEVAYFINTIVEKFNCSLSGIHIIGHSLGAHVAGEAGKRRLGIAKITCLDAAYPGFEGESDEVSVDATDANFVVAVHTSAGPIGLGMRKAIGHKDFYLNGGKKMPGCSGSQILDLGKAATLVGAARDLAFCSHVASYYVYTESIHNPGGFMGYCAPSYDSFQEGAGFPCSNGSCSLMGYYTEPGDASSCQLYYLNTGPRFNYERWRYNVTVKTNGTTNTYGSISVTLYNSSDFYGSHKIYSGSIVGGRTYSTLIDGLFPPPITRVTFTWTNFLLLFSRTLWAESVSLTYGNDGSEHKFCVDEVTREDSPQPLPLCP